MHPAPPAFRGRMRFFHTVENIFPLCGKLAKHFSIAWKTGDSGNEPPLSAEGGRFEKDWREGRRTE